LDYQTHAAELERKLGADEGRREAVGGNFLPVGKLEHHLLRWQGLRDGHLVVDVGCGCGRLAWQLAPHPGIRYLGTDVVPRMVGYARELCRRPDWEFRTVTGTELPCPDGRADFITFFSVFTHLLHEESYRYLVQARQCLKPGGKIVISYLEFRMGLHWAIFEAMVNDRRLDRPLNQFLDRDGLHAWAAHAGLKVKQMYDGDSLFIPIPEEIVMDNGTRMGNLATFGQSVAILEPA
jgi:SAM-dependent methyltransferase